ncbi:glycoside hydrolase family 2 TIM barrel-domain containing protein [uncultured Polaribacter sp.]|uniref:glycoside hydrolase family 2 protein n=1 Tax=uncultured Polaribacter sp. TaxID=174711 RepID=UPI0026193136|nr:glycoside hydrolase family 2 TIM barrel-domain containing protein [uncultured Polaribacter sp.]
MKNSFKKGLKYSFLAVIIISLVACNSTSNYERKVNFNQNWEFKRIEDKNNLNKDFSEKNIDISSWESVSLPHTAKIEPLIVNDQWQGICWYRKTFDIPVNPNTKKVFLELEAAMNFSKVWVNGSLVSEHHGGYLPVKVDITKFVKKGNDNIIAVKLDNTDNKITGPKPLERLDFNMFGGLYRNAWLHISEKTYISDPVLADKIASGGVFITYPKVTKAKSEVAVKTHIINEENKAKEVKLINRIFYDDALVKEKVSTQKIEAKKDTEFNNLFQINEAKLWSPKNPNLYQLETRIFIDEKEIDSEITKFGIREFTFDEENQLYINGEKTFLRGVNRHQEYPFVGYALSDNAQYRDAKKIKDAGFNYIRLSHYPQSPAFMDACDELGLVVIDAIMGWQYYNDTDAFRNYCYKSAKELIKRDRNRPSVLAWEVSLNETAMPLFFMEKLNKIVHEEYPGENVFSCGWKDDVYDIYLQARQHRILHPPTSFEKPYSVSEYGDWEYYSKSAGLNQDNLPPDLRDEMSSRQARGFGETRMLQQAHNIQEAHNDNLNTVAYSDSYWVMYDYNRGYHEDIERSGIMDTFRIPKFGYYFYQSQRDFDEGAVLKIASFWNEKSPLDIKVFSNADEVSLYLNDELIAKQKPDTGKNTNKLNHPPFTFKINKFEKGTIKAVGFMNGKEVGEDVVKTPQKPTKLKIWIDESGKKPQTGVNDVVFCYIAAVDDNGTINPNFSETIELSISEAIEILNVDPIKAEAGIATALIRIGNTESAINITAKSRGLKEDFEFKVK